MALQVIISGLSDKPNIGKMARAAATRIANTPGLSLFPNGFSAPEDEGKTVTIEGQDILLVGPQNDSILLEEFRKAHCIVDYSLPAVVNDNVDFFCNLGLPLVEGTTGGNRKALEERVKNSSIVAVIGENMGVPLAYFQHKMKTLSEQYPKALTGYTLDIFESHQATKGDTSGTAKSLVEKPDGTSGYFNILGIPYKVEQIRKERDPERQLKLGVPEAYLDGHGWHRYTFRRPQGHTDSGIQVFRELMQFVDSSKAFEDYETYPVIDSISTLVTRVSPDKTVQFTMQMTPDLFFIAHDVNGRAVYEVGTVMALFYAVRKQAAGKSGPRTVVDVAENE